jgi:hypothetical protein
MRQQVPRPWPMRGAMGRWQGKSTSGNGSSVRCPGEPRWTCSASACGREHSRAVPYAEKIGARSASFYPGGNGPLDDRPQYGLTGGNVRRDAIRGAGSSVFFLLAILHWHFRAKIPVKSIPGPHKRRKTTGSWAYIDNNSTPTIGSNLLEANVFLSVHTSCQSVQRSAPLLCATIGHTSSSYARQSLLSATIPYATPRW